MENKILNKAQEIKKTLKAYGHDYRHLDDLLKEVKELIKLIEKR